MIYTDTYISNRNIDRNIISLQRFKHSRGREGRVYTLFIIEPNVLPL